jgi:hypothetical protein
MAAEDTEFEGFLRMNRRELIFGSFHTDCFQSRLGDSLKVVCEFPAVKAINTLRRAGNLAYSGERAAYAEMMKPVSARLCQVTIQHWRMNQAFLV